MSSRLKNLRGSLTLAVGEKVARLKEAGATIYNMSLGEPQEPLHPRIQSVIRDGMKEGNNKYTQVAGMPELRQAVAKSMSKWDSTDYTQDQVIICPGTKNALYSLLMTTINPGDKVIMPTPYWPSYYDMTFLVGGVPSLVHCDFDQNLLLSAEALDKAIEDNSRWLVLNSPGNPSGMIYDKEHLQSLGEVLKQHPHVNVIWDDIYKNLNYQEGFCSLVQAVPELKDRVFTVGGVSKSHAMTGLRLGWCVGNQEIIKAMTKVQSHSITCASSLSQIAGIEALKIEEDEGMGSIVESYRDKLNLTLSLLDEIEGLKFLKPQGAFYVYVFLDQYMNRKALDGRIIETDENMAQYLLDKTGLITIPGFAFGISPALRLSYVCKKDIIEAGLNSMKQALAKLRV